MAKNKITITITGRSSTVTIPVRFVSGTPKSPEPSTPTDSTEPIITLSAPTPQPKSPEPEPQSEPEPELEPQPQPQPESEPYSGPEPPQPEPQTTKSKKSTKSKPKPKPKPKPKSRSKSKPTREPKITIPPKTTKPHKKHLRYLPFLFAAIFTALLSFAGLKIVQWHLDNLNSQKQQAETTDDANGREVSADGELVNPPNDQDNDYWYFIGLPFYEVDFDQLKARNPDTVAFIHMQNNNVNYPVVQTTNNDYYLHHAFDGSYNDAGWVYMDYRSTLDSPGFNTIIYGHGRFDGTVFGSLRNSITPAWQANRDNYAIWLSTPTENRMYQIFSIYTIPVEGYYLKQNFASATDKSTWLSTMQERNTAPVTVDVGPDDQILTLSTCLDDNGNRIVIHARLIKHQPRG